MNKCHCFINDFVLRFFCMIFLFFYSQVLTAQSYDVHTKNTEEPSVQSLLSDSNLQKFTLENGLAVFILEDSSTPLVRIEYDCRAGFSSQTIQTSGFFKLYSNVIAASVSDLQFSQVQCNADSTRYIVNTTSSNIDDYLRLLAELFFEPEFSNSILAEQLALLKEDVRASASSTSGFINSAIDSRVFSSSPWKHDTGVYPALFEKTTTEEARTILKEIADRWYTPQNSALFISGNVNQKKMLELIKNTFGEYYSSYKIPKSTSSIAVNKNRKFVLHDGAFSNDITQVVMQYTVLTPEECEVEATMLNNDYSSFKTNIIQNRALRIPGNDYINVAAAHKKDSSRLIIQSIFQKPEKNNQKNAKNKDIADTDAITQVLQFCEQVQAGIQNSGKEEFLAAKHQLDYNYLQLKNNSTSFMENLSVMWAMEPYSNYSEQREMPFCLDYASADFENIKSIVSAENPFVFVLVNSAEYRKNKNAFDKAGFEEITEKNASWYNQKLFENIKNSEKKNNSLKFEYKIDNDYFQKNLETIKSEQLSNGIPLFSKKNAETSEITLLLSVKGGKLKSAASNKNGFEETMIYLLASNIQQEIFRQQQSQMMVYFPKVDYECNLTSSYISITCDKNDFSACCKGLLNALVYEEISPAVADRIVSYVQYNKRLENGITGKQLYDKAIKQLYKETDFSKIFDTDEEILQNINFQQILESYPLLLNARNYSVILTGNFDNNYYDLLNSSLGVLADLENQIKFKDLSAEKPKKFDNDNENDDDEKLLVHITHKFFAAAGADKNAPMPSVLIPTTDFQDPVLYVYFSPNASTKESVYFEALLLYVKKLLENQNWVVSEEPIYPLTDTAGLIIQNVTKIKDFESAYTKVITELTEQFDSLLNNERQSENQSENQNDCYSGYNVTENQVDYNSENSNVNTKTTLAQKIKDNWIYENMNNAVTNEGTAILIQKGLEYFPYDFQPDYYLQQYNLIQNAQLSDFSQFISSFAADNVFKVYSADAK